MGLVKLRVPVAQPLGVSAVARDGRDRPLIRVPAARGGEKTVAYTRVTTFIDVLDDKTQLARWGERLILEAVAVMGGPTRDYYLHEVRTAVQAGDKRRLNVLAEDLKDRAGASDASSLGTWKHYLSEFVDSFEELPDEADDLDRADMVAYRTTTSRFQVLHAERFVVNDDLKVGGTPDRIVFYPGPDPDGRVAGNMIGDLKTGRLDYGGLKMAMQLAVYSRSMFYDHDPDTPLEHTRFPLPEVNQRWGVIVSLPSGSGECELRWVDLELGWAAVQLAAQVRDARRWGARALLPFGTTPVVSVGNMEQL